MNLEMREEDKDGRCWCRLGMCDMMPTKDSFVGGHKPATAWTFRYTVYWYDKKELGCYDYVSGGRGGGGAIEGGGLPLGTEMCGGSYDGGHCSMATANVSYSNVGCAGGGG